MKKKKTEKLSPVAPKPSNNSVLQQDQSILMESSPFRVTNPVKDVLNTPIKQKLHGKHNLTQVGFYSLKNDLHNRGSSLLSPSNERKDGLKSSRLTVFNVLDSKVDRIGMLPSPQERYLPKTKHQKTKAK